MDWGSRTSRACLAVVILAAYPCPNIHIFRYHAGQEIPLLCRIALLYPSETLATVTAMASMPQPDEFQGQSLPFLHRYRGPCVFLCTPDRSLAKEEIATL